MKRKVIIGIVIAVAVIFLGATFIKEFGDKINVDSSKNQLEKVKDYNFTYTVNPKTFEVTIDNNGEKYIASEPMKEMNVSDFKKIGDETSWNYPDKGVKVLLKKENDCLDVSITSTKTEDNSFQFPSVQAPSYDLPIGEGEYVPSDNKYFKEFFNNYTDTTLEMFSMPFFALNEKDASILYIINNPYSNNISFNTKDNIKFNIDHQFKSINKNKTYGFKIYLTENNPVDIAKTYKNYVVKKGDFKTLEQKEKENPNVKKLVGAPEIYLWNNRVIEPENINFQNFIKELTPEIKKRMISILEKAGGDNAQIQAIQQIGTEDYVDNYDKNLITSAITTVCMSKEFYSSELFKNNNKEVQELLNEGVNNLNQVQTIKLNELLLKEAMPNAFTDINTWADSATTDIINDLKESGITKAWIGFNNWTQAYMKPQMVTDAVNDGYLVAPYDSYTSIQDPGSASWDTADFKDKSLYNDATMKNEEGQYRTGFKNKGRLLNPTLAMPSVKDRVNTILNNIPDFNSWFVDCDAAGQVFNDYSKNHTTTKSENIQARLERLNYIGNDKHMIVGSEGGDDYASQVLDYAQGIDSKPISWMDKETMQNKKSEYYTGAYYSKTGGVPPKFSKIVPVQEEYKVALMDPEYKIPLYKLVYNNSIVNTYHWLWGTLKAQGELKNNLLHNILYNVPGLYHLDKETWNEDKNVIVDNTKVFTPFSDVASYEEMTNFEVLSKDRLVQMTEYGDNLKVISNFSDKTVKELGYEIGPKSLIIIEGKNGGKVIRYTPNIQGLNNNN
ncbi:MAG: glycoside hydrolase [Clostridium sp.]|uniref:glycoside hydrolase n=1 Tax=Clostridium sp. TaxID=1506 RepID=UPI003EE79EE4